MSNHELKKSIHKNFCKLTQNLDLDEKISLFMTQIGYIYLECRNLNPDYFFDDVLAKRIKNNLTDHMNHVFDRIDQADGPLDKKLHQMLRD